MPLICTCPQGHRWNHPGTAADTPPVCPTCGAAAANVGEDSGPDLQAETLTYTPGSHPLPAPPVLPESAPAVLPSKRIAELLGKLPPVPNPAPSPVPPPAPRAPLPPAPGPAPGLQTATPPRPATLPAENRTLPWLAERPRPEPPPRSPLLPALLGAGVAAGTLLALGALAWFLLLVPAWDDEREQLAADAEKRQSAFKMASQDLQQEREAHARTRDALKKEQLDREEAEKDSAVERQNADREKTRRQAVAAALINAEAKLKKALAAEARLNKELASGRGQGTGGLYSDRIALADLELRLKAPDRAAGWLRTCPPQARSWEWHFLNGQCDTETLTCGPVGGLILAVAYSPDGTRLAAGGLDQLIHVWDALTGKELFTCRGHTGSITTVAFSADGKRLVSGDSSGKGLPGGGEVRLWDAATGKNLQIWPAPAIVRAVAFGPDGRLAAGCADGTIKRWDSAGKELPALKHAVQIHALAFSPDGALLACCDGQLTPKGTLPGQVKVWDFQDGREVLKLKGHAAPVVGVAFAPDGKQLISADTLGSVKFWDAAARGSVEPRLTQRLNAVPLGPLAVGGKRLFVLSLAGTLNVMDAETGALLRTQRTGGRLYAVAATRDGARVATAEQDKAVHVRDFVPRQSFQTRDAHGGTITCLAFSADGRLLASAASDGRVRLWDARAGRELHRLEGLARPVREVAFSPDGKRLLTVGRPADGADRAIEVVLWDTATGKKVGEVPGQAGEFATAGFGPDGKRLLVAIPGKNLFIWDLEAAKAAPRLDDLPDAPQAGAPAERLAVSPDGKRVAVASSAGLKIFERAAGAAGEQWRVKTFKPVPGLSGLAWAPRGGGLLVGLRGSVTVIDAIAGKGLGNWKGMYPDPRGMALSPDGKRVFTAMGSPSAAVWELPPPPKGARPLLYLSGGNTEITCLACSPDGQRLVAGTTGGKLLFWEAPGAAVASTAK
jgi:WD40 repeat protein